VETIAATASYTLVLPKARPFTPEALQIFLIGDSGFDFEVSGTVCGMPCTVNILIVARLT
jgi:hypothetical protein